MKISKIELSSSVDSWRDFMKTFVKASNCLETSESTPKVEIGSTKAEDSLFAHYYNDIIEHPERQIC